MRRPQADIKLPSLGLTALQGGVQRGVEPVKVGQRPTLLPPATALALLWGERPCRRPRFIGPPFLPGALGDAHLLETRFRRKSPPQERISSAPGRPPEKHHEHRFAQHPVSKIQRADVRLLGGLPEAGIRARIMSISRALGAKKPAAKRPRSYMEGPCGRKLSIMSTVLPNTPSQESKEQMLSF